MSGGNEQEEEQDDDDDHREPRPKEGGREGVTRRSEGGRVEAVDQTSTSAAGGREEGSPFVGIDRTAT